MASKKQPVSAPSASQVAASASPQRGLLDGNPYLPHMVILLLAFVLYGNTIGHGYALDDSIVITDNAYTKKGLAGIGKIFSSDAFEGFFGEKKNLVEGGRYRPLSMATFALEWEMFASKDQEGKIQGNPTFSHIINVLLYACCGILVFVLMRMLFPEVDRSKWWMGLPFLITFLFLIHPIHTEVVANIKGRDELMALLFLLGGLVAVMRYVDTGKMLWSGIAFPLFFLALLSKETPLPFVVILPLMIWMFRKDAGFQKILVATAPLLVAVVGYLAIRTSVVGLGIGSTTENMEILNDPFIYASSSERAATVFETWGIYLIKLLAPVNLSHDYYFNQIPVTDFGNPVVLASLLVNLTLLGTGVWLALRRNAIGFGILFYFLSFSITSNLVISIGTTMGERFVFLPSLGFIIAGLIAMQGLAGRLKITEKVLAYALLGLVGLPFAYLTVSRNGVWKDNYTLFTTDVEHSPNSAKVQTAAGGVMIEQAEKAGTTEIERNRLYTDAIKHLNKAVEIYPEHGNAWLLMGNAYHKLNDFNNSLRCYQKALTFRPLLWDVYKNAQITARKAKLYPAASAFFQLELNRRTANGKPVDAEFWFERGSNYEEWAAYPDSAIWAYETAFRMDPKMAKALGQMGRVYGMLKKDYDNAILYGDRAVAIDPKLDWVFENMGIATAMKGDLPGAIAVFQRGLTHNPKGAKLYLNMGVTYRNMGQEQAAQDAFNKAFEIDPTLRR